VNGRNSSESLGTWTSPQCPFAIEYLPQVLEGIRMAVESAFYRLPHGGLEIGGILLGSHSAGRVAVTDFRPLQCEHAFGPSFRLTASDHSRLSAVIESAQAAGQTVVGWYHSHTRSEIFLSKDDLELHYHHFKAPWQVALVLKPAALKPTLCGFFFREADGSIHGSESYREFELEGSPSEVRHARLGSPEHDGQVLKLTAVLQSPRRPHESGEPSQTSQQPGAAFAEAAFPEMDENPGDEASIDAPQAKGLPQWEIDRRAALRRTSPGWRFPWGRVLAGVAIVLALGAAYAFYVRLAPAAPATGQQPAAEKTLGLRINRLGTDLVLSWDGSAVSLLGATAGLLSIKDGPTQKEVGLNVEQLRSAIYLVTPESDHMEIQLTLLLPNERTASELGIVNLPARTSADPVALEQPVQSKTYTETQIKPKPAPVKISKPFVAPPGGNHAPGVASMDQPPALNGIEPAERSQPSPLAALRTFRSFPPAPPVPTGPASSGTPPASGPPADLRVGGNVQLPALVSRRDPVYPHTARAAGIQDVVVLEGLVGTDGRMEELRVISGLQVFRQAALDAVSQWVYKPAMLNGTAVEARVRVEIRFREGM
jgi:TonB family protein